MEPPVEDVRGGTAEMPPSANVSIDHNDVLASSDNRLESMGASKTIIARYVPGNNIIFSVPFKSLVTSIPSAIWMQGPTRIEPSERFITMVSERSASLTIKHVGKRDCGRYSCRLRDSVSDATVEFNSP